MRPPSKATPAKPVTKSIASLGSVLSPEVISNIERAFLSPYYLAMTKAEKEQASNSPLLGDFDAEIAVYIAAREKIKQLHSCQDVNWIRVNLRPTIDVLVTLTNKLVWQFTSFLSSQIRRTLGELDTFLRRMEPEIEHVTGEERDTNTFMKACFFQVFKQILLRLIHSCDQVDCFNNILLTYAGLQYIFRVHIYAYISVGLIENAVKQKTRLGIISLKN